MKTLFLSHAAALGGAELYLLDYLGVHPQEGKVIVFTEGAFADALRAIGAEVEVVTAPSNLLAVARESGRQGTGVAAGVLALARRIARAADGFDLIFANSQKAFVVGALASLIARRPLVWCLHDILSAEHFSAANRRLVVALANLTGALVVANSQATADAFVRSGGRAARVRVVYNGIDVDAFGAPLEPPAARTALRAELGVGDAPLVGLFSRLSAWKGQHVLLEALAELPDAHAVLVGDALFGEDAYAEALHVQAERLGIAARVHFLGFRRDVPELMREVDVVAHTSTAAEPFGRVIVEGMLAGRPVVATRGGAVAEIVEEGVTGLTVEPGDASGLAQAVRTLLSEPERAAALTAAARMAAGGRFSLPVMAADLSRCLAEAVAPADASHDYTPRVA